MIQCPDCSSEFESLRGWKRHMSMTHGGWTEDQVAKIAENLSSEQGAVATGFQSFEEAEAALSSSQVDTEEEKPRKRRATKTQKEVSGELKKKFDAVCGSLAEIAVSSIDSLLTSSFQSEPMTESEKKSIKEAIEFPLVALNTQIEVEPVNVTITSWKSTLIVPVVAILAVVLSHLFSMPLKGPEVASENE